MSKKPKKARSKEEKPTRHQIAGDRRAEYSNAFHIVQTGNCYRVLQIPADNGEPFFFWPEEFVSETAAKVFRDEMIDAFASGNWKDAYCFSGNHEFYNVVGRILDIIENNEHDTRMLAFKIASADPWRSQPETQSEPDEFPF